MASRNPTMSCSRILLRHNVARVSLPARPRYGSLATVVPRTAAPSSHHASTFQPNRTASARSSAASNTTPSSSSSSSSSASASSPASPQPDAGLASRLAQTVRSAVPGMTETYIAYGSCEVLVKECARQADYSIVQPASTAAANATAAAAIPTTADGEHLGETAGSWWHTRLHLAPTFSTWAHVTLLHLWLVTVRLRAFPREHAPAWHQHLIDHFFYLAEDRMVTQHQVASKGLRQRYLKDLFLQWRGITAAYDEGLVKGDAVLAGAIWRNVCKADPAVDLRRLAEVVCFVRSVLREFDALGDEVIANGDVVFGDPGEEARTVAMPSRMMTDLPAE